MQLDQIAVELDDRKRLADAVAKKGLQLLVVRRQAIRHPQNADFITNVHDGEPEDQPPIPGSLFQTGRERRSRPEPQNADVRLFQVAFRVPSFRLPPICRNAPDENLPRPSHPEIPRSGHLGRVVFAALHCFRICPRRQWRLVCAHLARRRSDQTPVGDPVRSPR